MTKKKMAHSPATMGDIYAAVETSLGFTGALLARVIPLFIRYPLVSAENFDALKKALETLQSEFEGVSPFKVALVDSLLHTLEVERERIKAESGSAT